MPKRRQRRAGRGTGGIKAIDRLIAKESQLNTLKHELRQRHVTEAQATWHEKSVHSRQQPHDVRQIQRDRARELYEEAMETKRDKLRTLLQAERAHNETELNELGYRIAD